jgi:hypothetical protein
LFSGQAIYSIGTYYLEKNQAHFEMSLAHRQPRNSHVIPVANPELSDWKMFTP